MKYKNGINAAFDTWTEVSLEYENEFEEEK